MIDIKAIREAAEAATQGGWITSDNSHIYSAGLQLLAVAQHCRDKEANAKHIATANPATVLALCDEVERLKQQLTIYEKHGVTCQTFRHKLTGCAECNRDDNADDAMALDTLKLQARQYFDLLPDVESLRNGMYNISNQSTEPAIQQFARSYLEAK